MDRRTLQEKVCDIFVNELGLEKIASTDTMESTGADSLDRVELVMAFEEEFGLEIPDEDAEEYITRDSCTVEGIVKYLAEQLDIDP